MNTINIEFPDIKFELPVKRKSVEEYINQIDDLIRLVHCGQPQMTGEEEWLEYDSLKISTKLLVNNEVPYYYFSEFIHGF